jgi:hypothetical protein
VDDALDMLITTVCSGRFIAAGFSGFGPALAEFKC